MSEKREAEPDYHCEGCGGPYGDGPRNSAEYCPKCDAYWPHEPEVAAMIEAKLEEGE